MPIQFSLAPARAAMFTSSSAAMMFVSCAASFRVPLPTPCQAQWTTVSGRNALISRRTFDSRFMSPAMTCVRSKTSRNAKGWNAAAATGPVHGRRPEVVVLHTNRRTRRAAGDKYSHRNRFPPLGRESRLSAVRRGSGETSTRRVGQTTFEVHDVTHAFRRGRRPVCVKARGTSGPSAGWFRRLCHCGRHESCQIALSMQSRNTDASCGWSGRLASIQRPLPQAEKNRSANSPTANSSPACGPKFQASHHAAFGSAIIRAAQRQVAAQRFQYMLPRTHGPRVAQQRGIACGRLCDEFGSRSDPRPNRRRRSRCRPGPWRRRCRACPASRAKRMIGDTEAVAISAAALLALYGS